MDNLFFDRLTRRFASTTTRRGLLRGVAAGLLGGGLLAAGATKVDAACPPGAVQAAGKRCLCKHSGRQPVANPVCPAGKVACGGCCVPACTGGKPLNPVTCTCGCPFNDCDRPTVTLTGDAGPPVTRTLTIQDSGSGLATVGITATLNAEVSVPPFSPGASTVIVTAIKLDPTQDAIVGTAFTDRAGNAGIANFLF